MNDFSRDETEFGAFGDMPSRFGADRVAFTAPVLPVRAAVVAPKPLASAFTNVLRTPSGAIAAPVLLPTAMRAGGTDARTLDFETGQANLAPTVSQAPAQTAAQNAKAATGTQIRNAAVVNATAARTATLNVPYEALRAATDRDTLDESNRFAAAEAAADKASGASGAWSFRGLDFGLLPVAAKVIVPLVATAATGGLAAPSLEPALKALAAAKARVATGDIRGDISLVKQADDLITKAQNGIDAAKAKISDTLAAAASNVPDAMHGLDVLVAVDAARVAQGVPDGVSSGAALPRLGFNGSAFPTVAPRPVLPRAAPTPLLASGVDPSAAALAALQRYTVSAQPTDPKYLVLDTGKVFANEAARQALPGWLVRFDGAVLRQ